jgi:hypothetical protein
LTAEARTTAGNYNIGTEGLRRLSLPIPPIASQSLFAEFDAARRQSRDRLKIAEHHADRAFAGMVQMMFAAKDDPNVDLT